MPVFFKKALFPCVVFIAVFLLMLSTQNDKQKKQTEEYILKAYKNTVALYKNGDILKVYESIVLNTLPQKDIQDFELGITVSNPDEAEVILEDYDG